MIQTLELLLHLLVCRAEVWKMEKLHYFQMGEKRSRHEAKYSQGKALKVGKDREDTQKHDLDLSRPSVGEMWGKRRLRLRCRQKHLYAIFILSLVKRHVRRIIAGARCP